MSLSFSSDGSQSLIGGERKINLIHQGAGLRKLGMFRLLCQREILPS
jgi:hypothetical protein